ncbi:MAG: hypothetical protein QM779_16480 [Propionicimonas sp.]|uniref:hypothetical protein n=1 Tax=Propionicimonas sp. TaxID=1955623 RepID=UPI003D0DFDBF
MRLIRSITAGVAALGVAGVIYAGTAAADPATPDPAPSATATTTSDAARDARIVWFYTALTDVQRTCLADAAVQRPAGRLTSAQRKELRTEVRAALTTCGVTLPARALDRPRLGFGWAALSTDQQHCLAAAHLTRPVGRLTAEQRAAVRQSELDAAAACGVG